MPHNKKWVELFEKEKKLLQKTFGDIIIAIEHIGSTAIPGIPAKPIIDMNIGVKSLRTALLMKKKFKEVGYEHRPFNPGRTPGELKYQELYAKGPESKRTHYAHVTVYNSNDWNRDLLFRDYLRKHRGQANQYANLKKKLEEKFANDRYHYTKAKVNFIRDIIKRAERK